MSDKSDKQKLDEHIDYANRLSNDLKALCSENAALQARLDACVKALEEIRDEGVGALNNAFPDDAPEVVESMAQKAELALKAQRNKQ